LGGPIRVTKWSPVRVLENCGSVVRFKTWVERADGMLLVEEAEVIAPQT
jgi:hypothetical protein